MKLPPELTTVTRTSKTVALIMFIMLPLIAFIGGVRYQQKIDEPVQSSSMDYSSTPLQNTVVTTTAPTTPSAMIKPTVAPTQAQADGVDIDKIKYTLPAGWKSQLTADSLTFTADGGGYLNVKKVMDKTQPFSASMSRRDYYCKVSGKCIKETTFTPATMGNISGYQADQIDNSGGGREYFGAKGTSFYIISAFDASAPVYAKGYELLLSSLVF